MYLLPADAAGGEEEPVHEDAGAVVVGVIGQHAVPLVLLLTGTVSGAAEGQGAAKSSENEKDILVYFRRDSRADLLVDGLLELLVVEDGPHLAVAVARPEGGGHLGLGLTHVSSTVKCYLDLIKYVSLCSLTSSYPPRGSPGTLLVSCPAH